jgi:exodeoxyribonuclease VII large subunit
MSQLSLFELNSLVRESLGNSFPDTYWVEAELMEIRESKGHCYMELIQKDLFSTTPVARASAKCWRTQWSKVREEFLKATGGYPQPGMKLLLNVSVDFHPAYGFALIVGSIDPVFTLGDMARKRQEIIDTLKAEGVYDLQRELQLPLFCQRIAVISSQTAAGYGDFCNQLLNNDYGLSFSPTLFPAVMQGETVEQSIVAQLNEINNRLNDFDCVVIIRGGGATSDMAGFDSLLLAENVANFPLPIITGIGHERDECVLDLISYMKVKTPTAAAAFLIESLADVLERVEEARNTIVANMALLIERQKTRIEQLSAMISTNARLFLSREDSRLDKIKTGFLVALQQKMTYEKHRLQLMSQRVEALNPALLLKRGYSMTLLNGKVVRDASMLSSGQEIETILEKGRVKSQVK